MQAKLSHSPSLIAFIDDLFKLLLDVLVCSIALYFFSLFLHKFNTSCKKNSAILNTKTAYKMYINNAVFYIYIVRVTLATCNGGFNLILR